jgi:hypothetical protein
MLLGTLVKQVMRAQGTFFAQLEQRDPELAQRLCEQAKSTSSTPEQFVADTIGRFMSAEDGESWTTIIGNLQRSEDPGAAFIDTIIRKRLSHRCSA